VWVTNGATGACDVFDTGTLTRVRSIALGGDADNLRWDAARGAVYVGSGRGALSVIDPAQGTVIGRVALPAHPEGFQIERDGTRLFVNLPALRQIAVIDRIAATVIATWASAEGQGNYPMAMDERRRRLFVGTRQPPRLEVFDIDSGRVVAAPEAVGDLDDVFVDAQRGRAYAIGGQGRIDIFDTAAEGYPRLGEISTRAGARTGLWDEASNRLYVALPAVGDAAAEVRVFDLAP
jgi:DNA-binding beta-propeller fold protein YncE